VVDVFQQFQDGIGCQAVQRRGRFVAQKQRRMVCQCSGNGNALLLSAGSYTG
jgi:hypothetical protein